MHFNLRHYNLAAATASAFREMQEAMSKELASGSRHERQGLTHVHFSAQPKPFWSHLPVSPCLIDSGKLMHPTYPTKCADVEPKSGRV